MLDGLVTLIKIVLLLVSSALGFLYVVGIFLVSKYHRQKEQLIDELEERSGSEYSGQTESFADGRAGELREKMRPQLEKLERKQGFILDTLPFIRKS